MTRLPVCIAVSLSLTVSSCAGGRPPFREVFDQPLSTVLDESGFEVVGSKDIFVEAPIPFTMRIYAIEPPEECEQGPSEECVRSELLALDFVEPVTSPPQSRAIRFLGTMESCIATVESLDGDLQADLDRVDLWGLQVDCGS